jgi:predicted Rdx family selenoprotein
LGEVALVPVTGGVFTVTIWHATATASSEGEVTTQEILLWDRKRDGGFPGTIMKVESFLFPSLFHYYLSLFLFFFFFG